MTALPRLLAFAVALTLVFGVAAFAGSRIDAHPGTRTDSAEKDMDAMPGDRDDHGADAMPAQPVRGLAVSENGLTLDLDRLTAPRGAPTTLTFRIRDRRGAPVRNFDVEHTKRMHLIVVRRDMRGFQHLHPTQGAGGVWSVPVTLPDAGTYRVFADFSVGGKPYTLGGDLAGDGAVATGNLPAPRRSVTVDGLQVAIATHGGPAGRESQIDFTVTRGGRPVQLREYLGARGHLVALREGDLAFLHVHPDENRLRFMATVQQPAAYRLFLQFKPRDNRIHTAAFTQEVTR